MFPVRRTIRESKQKAIPLSNGLLSGSGVCGGDVGVFGLFDCAMKLSDESPMPFGRYKGDKMVNVPASYLMWLYDNNKCNAEVKEFGMDGTNHISTGYWWHKDNCFTVDNVESLNPSFSGS